MDVDGGATAVQRRRSVSAVCHAVIRAAQVGQQVRLGGFHAPSATVVPAHKEKQGLAEAERRASSAGWMAGSASARSGGRGDKRFRRDLQSSAASIKRERMSIGGSARWRARVRRGSCTANQPCTPPAGSCVQGSTDCSTGTQVCNPIGPVADGTPCGSGNVCSAGTCGAFSAGTELDPTQVAQMQIDVPATSMSSTAAVTYQFAVDDVSYLQ